MQNRFIQTHNVLEEEDEIEEHLTEIQQPQSQIGYYRKILGYLLLEITFILYMCTFGFSYTNQKYIKYSKWFKISIILLMIILLLILATFNKLFQSQPQASIIYIILTILLSFSIELGFGDYSIIEVTIFLVAILIGILSLLIAAIFEDQQFTYVKTISFIIMSQGIYYSVLIILTDISLNSIFLCSLFGTTYAFMLLYQFNNDLLELGSPLIGALMSHYQNFKLAFILVEALSGEYSG